MIREKKCGSIRSSVGGGSMGQRKEEELGKYEEGGSRSKVGEGRRLGWLDGLMGEAFFGICGDHLGRRKNEKNVFCLLCCISICPHCLPHHPSHPLLQVRRYVYQDVIRLGDLEKLIDCSFIQPYTINNAKVIFLNQRPQTRPCKVSGNLCFTCDRILQEPFRFCSLSCKVHYMEDGGEDISAILYRIELSEWPGLRMDSSEITDDEAQVVTEDSSMRVPCDEVNQQLQKKKKTKKGTAFLPEIVLSLGNRRKSAPHRAPLS